MISSAACSFSTLFRTNSPELLINQMYAQLGATRGTAKQQNSINQSVIKHCERLRRMMIQTLTETWEKKHPRETTNFRTCEEQ